MPHLEHQGHFRRSEVFVPPITSHINGADITMNPDSMFEILHQEQNFLGHFDKMWAAGIPSIQHVRDIAGNFHYMIFPKAEGRRIVTPSDITGEELLPAAGLMTRALDSDPNVVTTYNIGPPNRRSSWKSHPQSWGTLHIHIEKDNWNNIPPTKDKCLMMVELGEDHIETALTDYFGYHREDLGVFGQGRLIASDELKRLPYMPHAALTLGFDSKLYPEDMVAIMQDLHRGYEALHKDFFSIYVDNYDEAKQAQWEIPFNLRSHEQVKEIINNFAEPPEIRDFLKNAEPIVQYGLHDDERLVARLSSLDGKARTSMEKRIRRRRIHQAPCYSTAFFKNNDTTYMVFQPHFKKEKGGGIEALGIDLQRKVNPGSSLITRKMTAMAHYYQMTGQYELMPVGEVF